MPARGDLPHTQHIRPGDLVSHSEYGTGLVLRTRTAKWEMPHICEVMYRNTVHAMFETSLTVIPTSVMLGTCNPQNILDPS